MENVFAGCDKNVSTVVVLVAITTRFNDNDIYATIIFGFSRCTMGNGWKHIPTYPIFIACN